MCTPVSSFTFNGDVTVNGNTRHFTGQTVPIPAGFKNCVSRQGSQLTIQTTTPNGTFTNTLKDVGGKITGTLKFPGATVSLSGSGKFN
jgi:hypothetical protein